MRHRRSSASLSAAIAAAILMAQPAFALEPGVHVSPSSPAGIEYAFPLGSARGELSGAPSSSSAASTSSAPPFGVGVAHRVTERVATQVRSLEANVRGGSLGDLVLPLVGAVLLAGAVGGMLGAGLRRRSVAS